MPDVIDEARKAIEWHIQNGWDRTTIAWESVEFTDVDPTFQWIEPTILWGEGFEMTLGGGSGRGRNEVRGVLTTDIMAPAGIGKGDLSRLAGHWRALWNRRIVPFLYWQNWNNAPDNPDNTLYPEPLPALLTAAVVEIGDETVYLRRADGEPLMPFVVDGMTFSVEGDVDPGGVPHVYMVTGLVPATNAIGITFEPRARSRWLADEDVMGFMTHPDPLPADDLHAGVRFSVPSGSQDAFVEGGAHEGVVVSVDFYVEETLT